MNERQQILSQIKAEIYKNEGRVEEYYGVIISVYDDIDEYLDQLDNIYDKISLAQWANNFEKVEELIGELELDDNQRTKYLALKTKNADLNETINFELLSPKYDFLSNIYDMLTTDRNVQEQILSLSDGMLEVFKSIYNRINEVTDYNIPYITNVLRKIGYVTPKTNWMNSLHYYDELNLELEKLIYDGYQLTDKEIDTLLFLYNNDVDFKIHSIEEMRDFSKPNNKLQIDIERLFFDEKEKEEKNISGLKNGLLFSAYGIGLKQAQDVLKCYDLTNLEITEENKDLFTMYKAIAQIVNETNPDILISVYDNFKKEMNLPFDFRRITTFENDLRKEFSKSLTNAVYKPDNSEYTMVNGIKIYDAGVDFKMIVTAIGAYQGDFQKQNNYSDYWNSPYIRSHGNCCSLIGNSNLATATIRNVVLGFATMSDNMLLLSGVKDLNSTPYSVEFNISEFSRCNKYMDADSLLDNTRGEYNELVYERRDLSSSPKYYKKNPDYIVFIEEYEDIDKYLKDYQDKGQDSKVEYLLAQKQDQERKWQETLQAAKDFGVPVVKINREKCAKNETQKIQDMVEEFKETKNPALISQIITKFQNNRYGNQGEHPLIQGHYFSKNKMTGILEQINNTIISTTDQEKRNNLINAYRSAIECERNKVKYGNETQISAIDFDKTMKVIDTLANFDSYSNSPITPGKKGM